MLDVRILLQRAQDIGGITSGDVASYPMEVISTKAISGCFLERCKVRNSAWKRNIGPERMRYWNFMKSTEIHGRSSACRTAVRT